MPEPATNPVGGLGFERALAKLEEIVGRLESDDVPLAVSITTHERGAALKGRCERLPGEAASRRSSAPTASQRASSRSTPAIMFLP
jgi:exodeoxyribonuclease VII small subunit